MVDMVAIACPRCSSSDVTHTTGDRYHCRHCETHFVVAASHQPRQNAGWTKGEAPPPIQAPRAPSGGSRVGVLVSAGLALVVGIGVAVAVAMGGDATRPDSPRPAAASAAASAPAAAAAPAVARPPDPPRAELTSTAHGATSIGGEFWLVTYRNAGEVPIERPAAVVSLFDANGKRVDEHTGWATRKVVLPGENVEFLVLVSSPPTYVTAEVRPREPTVATGRDRQVPVTVTEQTERPGPGQHRKLVGTVRNDTDEDVQFIEVLVIGRDAAGKFVSHATGRGTDRTLAPGASTGFSVSTGTFELEKPASYDLYAFAQGK